MKPVLFAGLALALSVPAWSQPQPQGPPLPGDDGPTFDNGDPQNGPPQVGGPIQLQNPHRRGPGQGPMMGGGQGGGFAGNFPGAPGNGFSGGIGFSGGNPMPMPAPLPVSMFADERYLFVLRGDTLMQFDKKTLTLIKSIELPRPLPMASPPAFLGRGGQGGAPVPGGQMRSQTSPPLLRRDGDRDGSVDPTF